MSPNTLAIFVLQSSASLLLNQYVVACSPLPLPFNQQTHVPYAYNTCWFHLSKQEPHFMQNLFKKYMLGSDSMSTAIS